MLQGGLSYFPSSCGRKLAVLLELRWGPQETSPVASGNSSLLSSYEGEQGITLELLQGNQASSYIEGRSPDVSRVVGRRFGFLLNCDGDCRESLILPKGSQASFHVGGASWNSFESLQGKRASS